MKAEKARKAEGRRRPDAALFALWRRSRLGRPLRWSRRPLRQANPTPGTSGDFKRHGYRPKTRRPLERQNRSTEAAKRR